MDVGYIRVSTTEQNTARQEVLMKELGVAKVFIDKLSGKDRNRPALDEMMKFVREGDTVIVESISRFARSTKDLLNLTDELNEKNVRFVSKKETIDTDTPQGKFMLTVFGAMAQLEREQTRQRQTEGIEIAKQQGKYTGRKTDRGRRAGIYRAIQAVESWRDSAEIHDEAARSETGDVLQESQGV